MSLIIKLSLIAIPGQLIILILGLMIYFKHKRNNKNRNQHKF